MRSHSPVVLALLTMAAGCGADAQPGPTSSSADPTEPAVATSVEDLGEAVADLRADTNRDGVVKLDDPADDAAEDSWDATHGAVFLANIDDDQVACPKDVDDVELPKCHDAADDVVNGPDDAADLARLRTKPWGAAPPGATGSITFTAPDRVRLFLVKGGTFTAIPSGRALSRDELVSGVELAIEGRDIVRDPAVWNGFVDVTLTVTAPREGGGTSKASDVVRLRVAPVITFHHGLDPVQTFVSAYGSPGNDALRSDLAEAASAIGVPAPTGVGVQDPWAQDFFETGYMSMPAPGGKQHVIRVAYRSANVFQPNSTRNPLRPAGRVAFLLRGKDSAAIQQFDRGHDPETDTLNSFGNFETVPPYSAGGKSFPLGRVLRGSVAGFAVDRSFRKMVDAQAVQPSIDLDTSWLAVGHVDETLSFVKAPGPRGWVLLVNDAKLAASLLTQQENAGRGSTPMFVGKSWDGVYSAQVSISEVLSDPDVMGASAEAAVEVAAQVTKLKQETGLTDAELVKVPFLHMPSNGKSIAFQPGMVNGLYMGPRDFVAPDPHGPVIGGKDLFQVAMTQALAAVGVRARFAEDWDDYHRAMGEVHCGTNTIRAIPEVKWWETGR